MLSLAIPVLVLWILKTLLTLPVKNACRNGGTHREETKAPERSCPVPHSYTGATLDSTKAWCLVWVCGDQLFARSAEI